MTLALLGEHCTGVSKLHQELGEGGGRDTEGCTKRHPEVALKTSGSDPHLGSSRRPLSYIPLPSYEFHAVNTGKGSVSLETIGTMGGGSCLRQQGDPWTVGSEPCTPVCLSVFVLIPEALLPDSTRQWLCPLLTLKERKHNP